MDLRRLETFCRVAELKSFSRAAEAIYLTQPTVSGHITSLERDMGLKLFDRLGRETTLTHAGQILYRYSKDILRLRDEAINAVSEFSQVKRGTITLGGSTIPGEYVLPKIMGAFHAQYPGIMVRLIVADSQRIADLLLGGDIEVSVTGMRIDDTKSESFPLFRDRVVLVADPDHPLAGKTHVTWTDILSTPLLIREPGSGTRKAFVEYLSAAGYRFEECRISGEVGSTTAVKEGVKSGGSVGFVSDLAVTDELRHNTLVKIDVADSPSPVRDFFAAVRRGKDLSPPARRFLDFLLSWKIE